MEPTRNAQRGATYQPSGSLDYVAIFRGMWRRHKMLMLVLFVGMATPLLIWLYLDYRASYVSSATIGLEASSVLEQIPGLGSVNREANRRDTIASYMVLLKSRSVREEVVNALPRDSFQELLTVAQYRDYMLAVTNMVKQWLGKRPTQLSPHQRAVNELQYARTEFLLSSEAPGVFQIKATASTPQVAMDLVNTYIQVLLSRTRSGSQEQTRKAREFLEAQAQQAKENLGHSEDALTRFEQQKGRVKLGSQTELDLVRLSSAENSLAEAQASQDALSARIASLQKALSEIAAKKPATPTEPAREVDAPAIRPSEDTRARLVSFQAVQEQLARLEARLIAMRERYTEAHPQVQLLEAEVAAARAKVTQLARELPSPAPIRPQPPEQRALAPAPNDREEIARQLAALEADQAAAQVRVDSMRAKADSLRRSLRTLTQEELEFTNLRRAVEANRNLVSVLSDKLMTIRMREQGDSTPIRIIDPASYPTVPSSTQLQRMILMVMALAGTVALAAAFGVEFWKLPIETEADVEGAVGLPVFGSVGLVLDADGKQRNAQTARMPIVLRRHKELADRHAEVYRALRTNIEAERLRDPFRSLLVTSPGPSEGKSTTVLNLAHAFHDYGHRVLIIDADLRRSSLHEALGVPGERGLSDLLRGAAELKDVCQSLDSGLALIPGGPTPDDPATLLGSTRMKGLLDDAMEQFDIVFIDSAPVLAVSDTLVQASGIDRVLLVARAAKTSRRELTGTKRSLERVGARLLGVVLNGADLRDVPYYHKRYHHYYSADHKKGQAARHGQRVARTKS